MFVIFYNFCDVEKEKKFVDDICIVEIVGYQLKEKFIQFLIMVGQCLQEVRLDEFDGNIVEEVLEKVDIICSFDFDIVDVFVMFDKLLEQEKSGDS